MVIKEVEIHVKYNLGYPWYRYSSACVKGYLFYDGILYQGKDLAKLLTEPRTMEEYKEILLNSQGIFSAIVKRGQYHYLLIQDITRTFPLFFAALEDKIIITDDTFKLKDLFDFELDRDAIIEFLRVRYVLEDKTLLKGVKQVGAGEIVEIKDGKIRKEIYHTHILRKDEKFKEDFASLKLKLHNILNRVIERLIEFADGATIVIPLSGGYDSRLIATLLKSHNYEDVVLYTYGFPDSYEVQTAKKVAERLGYEWYHIEFPHVEKEYIESEEFVDFMKYSFNHVSTPHLPDFLAFKLTLDKNIIPKGAIIVPGHSGDVFAGSWLRKLPLPTVDTFAYIIKAKHFTINEHYDEDKYIIKKLNEYLKQYYTSEVEIYSLDDNWNFKERQPKFIINSNRAYEYFDHKHAIPLWDLELVEFFRRVPLEYKTKKILYNEVAMEIFKKYGVDFTKPSGFASTNAYKKSKYLAERYLPYQLKRILRGRFFWKDQMNFRVIVQPMAEELGRKYYFSEANGIIAEWVLKKFVLTRKNYKGIIKCL